MTAGSAEGSADTKGCHLQDKPCHRHSAVAVFKALAEPPLPGSDTMPTDAGGACAVGGGRWPRS